jgi:cytochrome c peroxidase
MIFTPNIRRFVFAMFAAASIVPPGALAAPPQVPRLPSQPMGYVDYAITNLPAHFANGPVASRENTPFDNLLSDAGATLGRVLFYDKRLSHDGGGSCASCHKQENGFSDPAQFSTGINGQMTGRHSMGLANSVYYASGAMFWDERAESLEEQALIPIQSPVEMGSSLPEVIARLNQTKFYRKLFEEAFDDDEITSERIGKAIAQFERAMVSYQAKFDTAFAPGSEEGDFESVYSADELAGRELFHGEGRCSGCHSTNAHVGELVANIGLDAEPEEGEPPVDQGAGEGRFKTPSLRNVGVRERFMHDGRFTSLQEVVEFYNSGVQDNPALDLGLRNPMQLGWTPGQVLQVVAYLETLTDYEFLASELFSDPFVTLPGDFDGNGEVELADLLVWNKQVGDGGSPAADGNNDGVVDGADFVVWQKLLGQTWETWQPYGGGGGAGAISAALPEPSGLALVLLTAAWGLGVRGRRRRGSRHARSG